MVTKFRLSLLVAILVCNCLIAGKWPGHAILGNSKLCGVYSDDTGITSKDGFKGFRHLYYNDFATDYIQSTEFAIKNDKGEISIDSSSTELTNFCTASSSFFKDGKPLFSSSVRAGAFDGLIFKCHDYNKETGWPVFTVSFNEKASPDGQIRLKEVKVLKNGQLIVKWSNDVSFIIYSQSSVDVYKRSKTIVELHFPQATAQQIELFLIAGTDEKRLIQQADSLNHTVDLWADADKHWNSWILKGHLPYPNANDSIQRLYNDYYSRNIYATFCTNLNGQVPDDVTGSMLSKGLLRIYPRNAMMVARNLLECGYPESASKIIRFWSDKRIPHRNRGEFYPWYDAQGKADLTNFGSRAEDPEWDAGGYLVCLLHDYYLEHGILLADTSLIYELADFLAESINSEGLLYEGGITEWTGYSPATNMIAAAGLMSAAEFAEGFGCHESNKKYTEAWKTISASLPLLFDTTRQTYTARRYWADKDEGIFNIFRIKGRLLYLWDATAVFGVLWGYPDHDYMRKSYDYTWETLTDNAGVRYFEARDKDLLTDYGYDLFFTSTAAHAEYAVMQHLASRAAAHINWMISNSNTYGLMPERILSDYSGCSVASPYTWSCAEFAASVKLFAKSW